MESKDAELKRRLKKKGIGGNKPRPMETEKITEVEKPTEANELEDSEAMKRLKAESIPAPSVDFPAVLPPPKPKKVKKESTGRPTQGKQAGLKMEAVTMPKTRVKAEEVKASDLKTEAASVVKPKAGEHKTSRGSMEVELKPAKRAQIGRKGRTRESLRRVKESL